MLGLWPLLSYLMFIVVRCSDVGDVIIHVPGDGFDKYLYPDPPRSLIQYLNQDDRTTIMASAGSNLLTTAIAAVAFFALNDCGLKSHPADCYNYELTTNLGYAAATIWYAGTALELALSERRLVPLLRIPFGLLALSVGYTDTVKEGLLCFGALSILALFSILFTTIPILYDSIVFNKNKLD